MNNKWFYVQWNADRYQRALQYNAITWNVEHFNFLHSFFFYAILQYNAFLSVPVKVFTCRVKLWQKMVCRFGFPETVWPLSSKRKPTLHDVRLSIICESTLLLKIEVSMIFFFYYYLLLFWNKVSCAHQGSIYWKSFSH